jgi:hypothetical protein
MHSVLDLYANAGTPLLWAGCFMLFFGNLVIAAIEARIIAKFSKFESDLIFHALIIANLVSAIVGFVILNLWVPTWFQLGGGGIGIERMAIGLAWTFSFALTLAIEWPILNRRLALSDLKASFGPFLAANVASYILLIGLASVAGAYGGLSLKSRTVTTKMSRPRPDVTIFYVTPDGRKIVATSADRIAAPVQIGLSQPLAASRTAGLAFVVTPTDRIRLVWTDSDLSWLKDPLLLLDPPVKRNQLEQMREQNGWRGPGMGFPLVRYLDHRASEEYLVMNFSWPGHDFGVLDKVSGRRFQLGLETPFGGWRWSNQTVIHDGWCVAEKGGIIYLIDLKNLEVGMIDRGFGAVVIAGSPSAPIQAQAQ